MRVTRGTWNLRSQRCFAPIRAALGAVRRRDGFRVVHFSVQHNHLHLIAEAEGRRVMSNGLRALLIRIARGLNGVMRVRGRRIDDRYHEHILRTPTEVRNALRYVIGNRSVHLARWGVRLDDPAHDTFSSLVAVDLVSLAEGWLLREGWTRGEVGEPRRRLVVRTLRHRVRREPVASGPRPRPSRPLTGR